MADMMTFPDTWEEFEEQYGITDREEIYTNGARLIPSFRVKQWLDHIADRKTEPKPCEWCKFSDGENCFSQEPCKVMLYLKTEPQTDGYMTAEQTEDYRKMLDKAEHKVYGNIEDEPQTEREGE